MNSIIYSIETNEEHYTNEADEEQHVAQLVENIEAKATEWMAENYPEVEFETRFVPESQSYRNKSRVFGDEQEMDDVLESLENYIGNNLADWWPE